MRKHRYIKLVTTGRKRNYVVSEPSFNIGKFFTDDLLEIEIKKTEILMNKPVYLRLSILELSKVLVYEFWYDYDYDYAYIKTDYIYNDIAEDVETRFDTWNYELDRPLPKVKSKKVIRLIKDDLGGYIMTKFVGLIAKTYS